MTTGGGRLLSTLEYRVPLFHNQHYLNITFGAVRERSQLTLNLYSAFADPHIPSCSHFGRDFEQFLTTGVSTFADTIPTPGWLTSVNVPYEG